MVKEVCHASRPNIPQEINLEFENGVILVGSDAHIWPGVQSTGVRAFIKFCKELKPKVVILNGDVLDFQNIGRHGFIGWSLPPSIVEEIEASQDVLHDIEMACGRGTRKLWTRGNHDIRFETRLSNNQPEFRDVYGTRLTDHFPNWEHCWSIFINRNVVVKHRFKGGLHAPFNNVLWSGMSMVTGHLHSQKVAPFTDYHNRTKYGVDTGCLAEPHHEAFDYSENNPKNWRSGFAVLTYNKGELLPPELVTVWDDNSVTFRGSIIKV